MNSVSLRGALLDIRGGGGRSSGYKNWGRTVAEAVAPSAAVRSMRYGILSDVHGNLEALEQVLSFLRAEGVERYLFLGDAVGYGASPDECCDLLRSVADHSVLGNHDAAVAGRIPYEEYYEAARQSLDWCAGRLGDDNLEWLRSLPYVLQEDTFFLCHGAPDHPEEFEYLFSAEQLLGRPQMLDHYPRLTVIGHSHLTLSYRIAAAEIESLVRDEIQLVDGSSYVFTVGSVGQPRDRDPRACCCTFDTNEGVMRYHRVSYDVLTARQKIHDAGLAQTFGDRLLVGM